MNGTSRGILREGHNVWQRAMADHFTVLVDAATYYRVLARALLEAERSILIIGWDTDSRLPIGREVEGMPETLGPFLDALLERREDLRVRILSWAFSAVYLLEREPLPRLQLGARRHARLDFELDGTHPIFAAHHQKIVVVDDTLAFSGGIDLCSHRWDTPEHRASHPLRTTPSGEPYPPFHDVHAMVDGAAARALAALAHERWQRATGERLEVEPPRTALWPKDVTPDFSEVVVGIARTESAYAGRPPIREVEALYLDGIGAARRHVYLENQYVTSERVCAALAARLAEPDGPEIVIVGPESGDGWIESQTVGAAHSRALGQLRAADRHDRLRIVAPVVPDGDRPVPVFIHSKIMIVDDQLLRVGSANLTNRSLGVDTECDLVIEAAGDGTVAARIASVGARLIGEHLGMPIDAVRAAVAELGLAATLDRFGVGPRGVRRIDEAKLDAELPPPTVMAFADPDVPVSARHVLDATVPPAMQQRARRPYLRLALTLAAVLALTLAWRLTPLARLIELDTLLRHAERLRAAPFSPVAGVAVFAIASQLMIPVNLLVLTTIVLFGPVTGAFAALGGAVAAASLGYGVGALIGRDGVRRLGGRRAIRLKRRLASSGVVPVLLLRLVPVAPAQLVSMVAGAAQVRFGGFLIGTLLGAVPGVVALGFFGERLLAILRAPGPRTIGSFVALGVALIGLLLWTRSVLRRRSAAVP